MTALKKVVGVEKAIHEPYKIALSILKKWRNNQHLFSALCLRGDWAVVWE
jgi:hypothetical protein